MIEAILFDKDGTLFDFQATWTLPYHLALEELAPGPLHAAASDVLGFDTRAGRFRPESPVIASTTSEVANLLSPVIDKAPGEIISILNRIGQGTRQVEAVDLRACLSVLRERYVLGLVTNDSEAPARAHLEEAGVAEHFAFVAGYDSGFGAKPAPGQLLAFADETGVPVQATLMVGDSRHDLMAAREAGMIPVGVLTGVAEASELRDLAQVILPDIGHLETWIAERFSTR